MQNFFQCNNSKNCKSFVPFLSMQFYILIMFSMNSLFLFSLVGFHCSVISLVNKFFGKNNTVTASVFYTIVTIGATTFTTYNFFHYIPHCLSKFENHIPKNFDLIAFRNINSISFYTICGTHKNSFSRLLLPFLIEK